MKRSVFIKHVCESLQGQTLPPMPPFSLEEVIDQILFVMELHGMVMGRQTFLFESPGEIEPWGWDAEDET